MKKLLICFISLLVTVSAFTQEGEEKARVDTTKIEIGSLKIIVYDENSEDDNDQLELRYGDGEDAPHNSRAQLTHWGGIDIGVNFLMDKDGNTDFEAPNDWLNQNMGQSGYWGFNVYEQKIRLWKDYVGLITGVGVDLKSFGFRDSVTIGSTSDSTFAMYNSDVQFRTNKLRTSSLKVPLLLEFNTSNDNRRSFHIALGLTASWRYASVTKQKYTLDGKNIKQKVRGDYNLEDLNMEANFRIGYRNLTLFVNSQLTPLFKENKGPEVYPVTVGLSLVNW